MIEITPPICQEIISKVRMEYLRKQYEKYFAKNNTIPKYFNVWDCVECSGVAPTITSRCGSIGCRGTISILTERND